MRVPSIRGWDVRVTKNSNGSRRPACIFGPSWRGGARDTDFAMGRSSDHHPPTRSGIQLTVTRTSASGQGFRLRSWHALERKGAQRCARVRGRKRKDPGRVWLLGACLPRRRISGARLFLRPAVRGSGDRGRKMRA
ncbi:Hypothetical predicted protein [Podarcis lilfordi]|uniref:Uncharacterized protein n=1 Tax=Podarcis lilfordi TaxID=74358 RepID=A0AA35PMQ7_9SAUR|nr:Hypothetical predicted protein [Podarcis lilfordi]